MAAKKRRKAFDHNPHRHDQLRARLWKQRGAWVAVLSTNYPHNRIAKMRAARVWAGFELKVEGKTIKARRPRRAGGSFRRRAS